MKFASTLAIALLAGYAVAAKPIAGSATTSKSITTSTIKASSSSSSFKTSTTSSKSSSSSSKTSTAASTKATSLTSLSQISSLSTISSLISNIVSAISSIVHGKALSFHHENPFTIATSGSVSSKRYTHDLTWSTGPKTNNGVFTNWTTYNANGVNMGCWLELEYSCYEVWWASLGTTADDEWDLCEQLGDDCGPVLENHYATFVNKSSIDKVAAVGVNALRIPTTYAAWVDVPGSQFYHGNQSAYLLDIAKYAIETYGMHVVIGLHSLPGGVNDLDIGEASGHDAWFSNSTNLQYSLEAVNAILEWMESSGHVNSFTIEPINEAANNISNFGTCEGLTTSGADYVAAYINLVIDAVAQYDSRIPVMFQDCFCGESFWSPYFNTTANLVFDTHVYYFADAGVYSEYVAPAVCGQAATLAGDDKFPVFVGEWSLQTTYNNTYDNRATIFDTQRYAWATYVHGGSMWNIVHYGNATVSGQGDQEDYWSYIGLIDAGVITSATNASYC